MTDIRAGHRPALGKGRYILTGNDLPVQKIFGKEEYTNA